MEAGGDSQAGQCLETTSVWVESSLGVGNIWADCTIAGKILMVSSWTEVQPYLRRHQLKIQAQVSGCITSTTRECCPSLVKSAV